MKKFLLYLGRWQASTPILYGVIVGFTALGITNGIIQTVIANLIGGCIFFWVDKKIFGSRK
jgi:hypothetical protein